MEPGAVPGIIDAHFHLWRYDRLEYEWIDDGMAALRRDFLAADLEAVYAAAGVDGGLLVQARQSLEETRFLIEQKRASSKIHGVVGWVDLRSERVGEQLDEFAPELAGVRHIVQAERDDEFLLRPDFQRGIRELLRHDLAYDVLIYPKHLGVAERFVAAHPEQRFVLDHLGKPFIREQELEPWASDLRALGRHANVSAKLSGLVTEADWPRWQPRDLRPYLDIALEVFGPRRLLFGSDWPVCLAAAPYDAVVAVVREFVSTLSRSEQASILGGNAKAFYRLPG